MEHTGHPSALYLRQRVSAEILSGLQGSLEKWYRSPKVDHEAPDVRVTVLLASAAPGLVRWVPRAPTCGLAISVLEELAPC